MLTINQMTKTYGHGETATPVLKGIDLEVNDGEMVILHGSSGSGKSTLLTIIGGLLTPTTGTIELNGRSWNDLSTKEMTSMRLHDIGFIFQSSHLLPYLNVKDQLISVAEEKGVSLCDAEQRAAALLHDFGLSHRAQSFPNKLSGGEKQRTAIARAFMNNPKIILADEPTASLDKERAFEVVEMLKSRVQSSRTICIMITHDQRLFSIADRLLMLDDGVLIEQTHQIRS
ncbi:ABC transporter ATP-binding protein [Macrococcus hajekii]|uniref:Putative hemin import ATP-binding protein HrtA n=1 Tax=Macrococcus hajekii TaxID=198482 RepID=A0A4V3BEA2_9STAP|nr:ABC transporter ATP-binding protein [Macrococcus hajekii]TDM03235.1 ABC transporter ATP-binding protein [Macrococcus hajekii]GGA97186.1 ABC transporter ATP-binding protein [Macrococcus hajekii]